MLHDFGSDLRHWLRRRRVRCVDPEPLAGECAVGQVDRGAFHARSTDVDPQHLRGHVSLPTLRRPETDHLDQDGFFVEICTIIHRESFMWAVPSRQTGRVNDFDLLVLGSGPGGQRAAIAAAKLGRRVAIVDRNEMIGGVCINTGTIPSKTLREAVLYLTGLSQRELYGQSYRVKDKITVADLGMRTQHVIGREVDVIRNQLARNHVTLLPGMGHFLEPNTIGVTGGQDREHKVTADRIVIATGTSPARPDTVEFDDRTVIDSDGILHMDRVPDTMVVVGAGVIGIEYASMFAALGTKITVVERRERMLDF